MSRRGGHVGGECAVGGDGGEVEVRGVTERSVARAPAEVHEFVDGGGVEVEPAGFGEGADFFGCGLLSGQLFEVD